LDREKRKEVTDYKCSPPRKGKRKRGKKGPFKAYSKQ